MQSSERIWNAVLHQVIAGRHLSAKAVSPVADGHFAARVGCGLYQHRHGKTHEAQRIGDSPFVAEIRKSYDNAVERVAMLLEECGAALRFFKGFDCAEFRFFRRQRDHFGARLFENTQHVFAAGSR